MMDRDLFDLLELDRREDCAKVVAAARRDGERWLTTAAGGYAVMTKRFKVGDHVTWNSEAGRVRGHIVRVHTKDVAYKGYTHHASTLEPQYEIKSDKTDHLAMHKGSALKKVKA